MNTYIVNNLPPGEHKNLDIHMDRLDAFRLGLGDSFIEFKHVMEPFPNPILITTADARIIYVNPAWEKLTGYKLAETEGENPNIFKSDKTPKKLYKAMWKALLSGKSFTSEDMVNRRKSGEEYQIDTTIFPIQKDGKTIFYVQVEHDITNRKKLEELKRQFLHAATHELKTPITALKLLLQLQLRKLVKNGVTSDITNSMRLVDRELDRLTRLINELSDVARIESGRLKMDMRIIDISTLISDVVEQMQVMSKGHTLVFKKSPKMNVLADADRIKQVLINLITNAIKYSIHKEDIFVTVRKKNRTVTVSVRDKGAGIPKKQLSLIFNRYYQIDRASQDGFGLGLYIAREIIKEHKGKISVKSELNKGSTFYFTLRNQ